MVCHETYKDENNKWLSIDEVETKDGKNYFLKKDPTKKVIVGPSESMSKSKKNTIDPEEIIENYGADAVRLFMLSDSPPEKDVQWSEQGMIACYKFIQKLWTLHEKIKKKIEDDEKEKKVSEDLNKFTNQLINKINKNLEKFNYNVIIAKIYEMYNFFNQIIVHKIDKKTLVENYIKILSVISPVIPHYASECFEDLGFNSFQKWPLVDNSILDEDVIEYVIQINGKKRSLIKLPINSNENFVAEKAKKESGLKKYLINNNVKKQIYVKNRLINFII